MKFHDDFDGFPKKICGIFFFNLPPALSPSPVQKESRCERLDTLMRIKTKLWVTKFNVL